MPSYDDINGTDLPMPFGEHVGQSLATVPPEYLKALLEESGDGISELSGAEMGKIYRCKIAEPAALMVDRWAKARKPKKARKRAARVDTAKAETEPEPAE